MDKIAGAFRYQTEIEVTVTGTQENILDSHARKYPRLLFDQRGDGMRATCPVRRFAKPDLAKFFQLLLFSAYCLAGRGRALGNIVVVPIRAESGDISPATVGQDS